MFKDYQQNQLQLLPQNLNELIADDHTARLINRVIDEMDLSFMERTYSPLGQKAYNPRMLFKVLVYAYTTGICSSRKIADRLQEDVVLMWLSGRQTPDFRTIADFRKDKLMDVKKAFQEVLDLCRQLGLIHVGKVSIDGTKFRSDSNGNKMQYRKILEQRVSIVEKLVEDIFDEAEKIDQEEDQLYGNSTVHRIKGLDINKINKELTKLKKRKSLLAKKTRKLIAKKTDLTVKLRKMRKDRNTMSTTDQDATLMFMKERYIAPGYNTQFATEHQVILGYTVTSDRTDYRQLKPMVKEVQNNTDKKPEIVLADAGYGRKINYRYLKHEGIAAFIPYGQFNKEMAERRKGIYTKTKDKELAKYKLTQCIRLLSAEGKKMMKRRREDIEPVIGDIKRNINFRTFHLRGKPKCLIEIGLVAIGHNLKKIKNHLKKLTQSDNDNQLAQELGQVLGYQMV